MSLESYLREREAQREREPKSTSSNESMYSAPSQVVYIEKRHKGWGCLISFTVVLFLIGALLAVAALKNPSPAEVRNQIRQSCIEIAIKLRTPKSTSTDSSKTFDYNIQRFLLNAFPSLLDGAIDIHTIDYVFFTTFEVTTDIGGEIINIMSGVVLFGKTIPMKSDLDRKKLSEFGIDI